MAYQPKYAKGKQKKNPRSPVRVGLTLLIIPISLALSWLLLKQVYFQGPQGQAALPSKLPDAAIAEQYDAYMEAQLSKARDSLVAPEKPQAPAAPVEETVPPYEPRYSLAADVQVAPEPNQSCFGQVSDPRDMADILKQAEYILDGQTMYFSMDTELFEGSLINYYLDESIFAVTWKEPHDNTVYTFSEVKIGHPSQLRRHLSDGAYGSGKLYFPTEMAATVNAVVATSGDFYANRPLWGVVAYEGQVRRDITDTYAETCYIDGNGDLLFSHTKQLQNTANAQAFLDENHINFSLAFGPILVENYEAVELPYNYGVGEIREEYARSALCQMDKLHYLVAVANWEGNYPDDPTVARFQKVVAATGCKMGYCLDGGQTATVIMNDQLINRPAKGEQRRISDIVYFATAVPEGG